MRSKARRAGEQGRRSERLPLDQSARLRPNGWSSLEVRVLDLSESGFRASCEARVQAGSCVSLDVPGLGPVEAQVEWQRSGQFGARFVQPIDLDRCGWALPDHPDELARLLVQRAGARQAGRTAVEADLRRQILDTLPVRRIVLPAGD